MLGQLDCGGVALSLYRLSVMSGDRPVVLMFYGPSGVGKTKVRNASRISVAKMTGFRSQ